MTRGAAVWIAVFGLRAAAQSAAPCMLSGTVLDDSTGKPVERARVLAEVPGRYSFLRLTDAQGGFCFARLAPAEYRLMVQKPGYGGTVHAATLAVEDENTTIQPVTVRMTRDAGVAGVVVDAEGAPVPGAEVSLWKSVRNGKESEPDLRDGTETDARGAFEISQLEPGTYYLSANRRDSDAPRLALPFADAQGRIPLEGEVETFYSGSFTFADATPLQLTAGQRLDHLLLTTRKARLRRVTGRIANPPPKALLYFNRETGTESEGGAIPIASDGSFVKTGLLPGRYSFRLGDGQKPIARKDVDLSLGDALNLTLDPIETMDVTVTFRTEGKGPEFRPPAGTEIWLREPGSNEAIGLLKAEDGGYRFHGVARGIYELSFHRLPAVYLKGVAYGGETQTGDKIDLRSERAEGLELTFSYNVAEVAGQVALPEKDAGDLTVILVDESKDAEPERIAGQAEIDQKGRFRMPGLAPGIYRLFAIARFDDDRWGSREVAKRLREKSVEVELNESERKQVSLTPISAEEWAAAVKRAGE